MEVTVVLGILFTTSEILPYIKQIKSNGILELLINNIIEILRIVLNSLHTQGTSGAPCRTDVDICDNLEIGNPETQPLLENDRYNDINYTLNQKLDFSSNLNASINYASTNYASTNYASINEVNYESINDASINDASINDASINDA